MGYFIKVLFEKGKTRVKVLPSQKINFLDLDTTFDVKIDANTLVNLPINSILYTKHLDVKSTYYKADDIWLLEHPSKGAIHPPINNILEADSIMQLEYAAYVSTLSKEDISNSNITRPKRTFLTGIQSKYELPKLHENGISIAEDKWYHLIRNVQRKQNTMLTGHSGTGKTEVIANIAKCLDKKLYIFDMGSMHDAISGLLGVHRLKEGKSVFEYSRFVEAIQTDSIVLLDEINRAPITTNNLLFPCLDFRRSLPVEIATEENLREIKVHPDCVFFATANLGGEYVGTNQIDRALLDRFQLCEMKVMNSLDEATVLQARTGIDSGDCQTISAIVTTLRDIHKKGQLDTFISTRHSLQVAELVRDGYKLKDSINMVLFPLFDGDEDVAGTQRNVVKNAITTH